MKTFLKQISLILACVLLLGACSSGEDNAEKEKIKNDIVKDLQGEVVIKADTTITLYTHHYNHVKDDVNRVMEELNKRLIGDLGIELKLKQYPNGTGYTGGTIDDYEVESIERDFNSNQPSDMYIVSRDMVSRLAPKGILMDLTELLPKYAPNYYKRIAGVVETAYITHNDRLMAIPPFNPTSYRYYIAVRSDIAEKYNVKEISDLSDYGALLERIKEENSSAMPMDASRFYISNAIDLCNMRDLDGYIVYKENDPEKQLVAWEDTSEFYDIISRLNDWAQKGYIYRKPDSNTETILAPFVSLDSVYNTGGKDFRYKLYPLNSDINWNVIASPIPAIAINSNSRNAEAVLRFIEWIHFSQENYDLLMYGIEGNDYDLDNGVIKFDDNKSRYFNSWSTYLDQFKDMELDRVASSAFTNFREVYDMEMQGEFRQSTESDKDKKPIVFSDGAKKVIEERERLFNSLMESVMSGQPASEWNKILEKIKETDSVLLITELNNQRK